MRAVGVEVTTLSNERVFDELTGSFPGPGRGRALELLVDSPRRNTVLKKVFDRYGVVLIVEGSDATENRRVRSMADAAVSRITAAMPGLENWRQRA